MSECRICGNDDNLRYGVCFDCASKGEERAAKRSVWQHVIRGIGHVVEGPKSWWMAKCDFRWAWERMTRTGDYAKGGTFDWEGYDWR